MRLIKLSFILIALSLVSLGAQNGPTSSSPRVYKAEICWQTLAGSSDGFSMASGTSYYFGMGGGFFTGDPSTSPTASWNVTLPRVDVPMKIISAAILNAVGGTKAVETSLGSFNLRINNSSNSTLISNISWANALGINSYTVTGLSINLNPGDFFQTFITAGTFTTAPTLVFESASICATIPN